MAVKGSNTFQVTLMPTGPGEPRQVTNDKDGSYAVVGWLPDSSGAVYMTETDSLQGWLARLDGSPPSPITPPGWWIGSATPDGKYVLAEHVAQPDDILYLYAIDGSQKIPLPIALPVGPGFPPGSLGHLPRSAQQAGHRAPQKDLPDQLDGSSRAGR
jgi:hypothetical protein